MKTASRLSLVLLFSFLLILKACAPSVSPEEIAEQARIQEEIEHLGNRYLELDRFGGSILIARNQELIYHQQFGMADYEKRVSFTNQTTFKLGVLSELVTRQIVLDLAHQDLLDLSDPVSEFLPDLNTPFTIQGLLDHQTRLPTIAQVREQNPNWDFSTLNFVRWGLEHPAGIQESALNYNLLGLLIESVSKQSLETVLQEYNQRWGLKNTFYDRQEAEQAIGYLFQDYGDQGLKRFPSPTYNLPEAFSSRGLKSTAIDLLKVIQLNPDYAFEKHGFLPDDGFSFSLLNQPEEQISLIILSNRRHPVTNEMLSSIQHILKGKAFRLPLARKPIPIDSEIFNDYVGPFALNEFVQFEVKKAQDSLYVMLGPNRVDLIPQSENQFFLVNQDASMRFERDSSGQVNSILLLNGFLDSSDRAKRMD